MIFEIFVAITFPPILYFIITYVNHVRSLKRYPKGPFPLPVIGNLNLLSPHPYVDFKRLAKQYGGVYGFSLGMNRYVIVNSAESVREGCSKKGPQIAGRPNDVESYIMVSRNMISLGFSEGTLWKLLRKVTHSALKVYGSNLERFNETIVTESEHLHKRLREMEGEELETLSCLGPSVLNVICQIVFSSRYDGNEAECKDIIKFQRLVFDGLATTDIVMVLPWIRYFKSQGYESLKDGIEIRDPFLKRKLQEHKNNFDADNIRDFTDGAILLADNKSFLNKFGIDRLTDSHLEMMINDMLVGGNETTLTSINWFVAYMIHWPRYQEIMYEEVINVIGFDRYPTYADKNDLPFVSACISELLRFCNVAPLGVPRRTTEDCTLEGKDIPKGTTTIFNLWAIHMDEDYWINPKEFNPYRWLDEDGNSIEMKQYKSFLPFTAGPRGCPGQDLARMELFIFLSRLIRDFRIEKPENGPLPDLVGNLGITLTPKPYKAKFISRNNNI